MNDAVNMAAHVAPKSDQLNADDLIAGPRTITITRVRANGSNADQPVAIHFDGDNNKPYLACKSMRRVMVHVWGADTTIYVGRSMTLYCDPEVQFGGMKVGGIRISHMSHIDEPKSMPLTTTRARRALFTVQPLQRAATTADPALQSPTANDYAACPDRAAFDALERRRADAWKTLKPGPEKTAIKAASDAADARIRAAASPATTSTSTAPAAAEPKAAAEQPTTNSLPGMELGVDEAGTDKELRACKSTAALKAAWAKVAAAYGDREVPLAIEAAYQEMKETLEAKGN